MSEVRAVTAAIEGVPVPSSLGGLRQPSADRDYPTFVLPLAHASGVQPVLV